MKKKTITVLSTIAILIIVGAVIYNYMFNSKHRDVASEAASASLSAIILYEDFQKDEVTATTKYLDKVVEINGVISAVEDGGIVLSNQIQVGLDSTEVIPKLTEGLSIIVKGRCVGYDELLEMVKLDQAVIINK